MSEATLSRIIDSEQPLLMIDEARILETNCDRGDLLKAILHEGYKKGDQVPRCQGEDNVTIEEAVAAFLEDERSRHLSKTTTGQQHAA